MRNFRIAAIVCIALLSACSTDNTAEPFIEEVLSKMTLEEKVSLLHAQSKFSSAGVQRLGIPDLHCSDGPNGVRQEILWDDWHHAGWTNDSCVAFPSLTCLAASWDRDMAAKYGIALGEEARFRGKEILLGPGVNIYRTPLCGRNFEYMGEDPYLAAQLVVPYVQGVQKNGVSACVKHFCLNNEETFRNQTDVEVDDRALFEIYLPAFKSAVQDGHVWSVMTSYNKYKGEYTSHSHRLICDILKGEWGFDGVVVSDWGSIHDTELAVKNGMDLEFGTNAPFEQYYMAEPYLEGLRNGEYSEEELNDKCRRVLRLINRTALNRDRPFGSLCSDEHYAVAREVGANGIVMLKNDNNLFPVKPEVKRIAVIGENALKRMTVGGGAASLKVQHEISYLQGIIDRAGNDYDIVYSRGYVGSPVTGQDGMLIGTELIDNRPFDEILAESVDVAKNSDLVVFVGGMNKDGGQDCEGFDRTSLELAYRQNEVIEALAEVNPNIVVVLVEGSAVLMPWLDKVSTVFQTWYLGSEAGNAFADVMFGDVNPSGKLPFTFPAQLEDSPAHYQGKQFPNPDKNIYEESIYVGYRWFEHKKIEPLFSFGYGLSYTTFEYGDIKTSKRTMSENGSITIRVPVTNTGSVAGAEVVQLYITDEQSTLERPEKELKDFAKIMLQPGETKTVEFTITGEQLQYYNDVDNCWVAEPGTFIAHVAAASNDIRKSVRFTLR